jgi:hypothetical protein
MTTEQLALLIIVIVLVCSFCGGAWGSTRYGPRSYSPFGVLLAIALILIILRLLHLI